MERVRQILSVASIFWHEGNRKCAYYKYLDAVLEMLDMLGAEWVFGRGREKRDADRLFEMCGMAMERAGVCLSHVLDLSEEEAEISLRTDLVPPDSLPSTAIPPSYDQSITSQTSITAPKFTRPPAFTTVDMSGVKDTIQGRQRQRALSLPMAGIMREEEEEEEGEEEERRRILEEMQQPEVGQPGPEPPLEDAKTAELPAIPMSELAKDYCRKLYELQLQYQKMEQLRMATAKQRSNGIYMEALIRIIQRVHRSWQGKIVLEHDLLSAGQMNLRDIPPHELARQFTLLVFALFRRLQTEEIRQGGWNDEERYYRAPYSAALLDLFSYVAQWCQYEVLRPQRDSDRASILCHLIKTAANLRDLGNYETLCALTQGLMAGPVQRLRRTLALVPKRQRQQLESLRILTSEHKNYAQLRDVIAKGHPPLIPYMGILLNDAKEARQKVAEGMGSEGFAILEKILQRILHCQRSTYESLLPTQASIQHFLLTRPFRLEQELLQLSLLREPPQNESESHALRKDYFTYGDTAPPPELSPSDIERLTSLETDRYDILFQRIRGMRHSSSPMAGVGANADVDIASPISLR